MAEDRYIYHPIMQAAIDNNGGMHFAHIVGGLPCGTVCEAAELFRLNPNYSFAHTDDLKQVTCKACLAVLRA